MHFIQFEHIASMLLSFERICLLPLQTVHPVNKHISYLGNCCFSFTDSPPQHFTHFLIWCYVYTIAVILRTLLMTIYSMCIPLPFLLPTGSTLTIKPPLGTHTSSNSSLSLSSCICSSVSPIMLGGNITPCFESRSISVHQ